MTERQFAALFRGPRRTPEELLTCRSTIGPRASIQALTEEIGAEARKSVRRKTGAKNLPRRAGVRAELRGERQAAARKGLRRYLGPAALGDCRRRGRRGFYAAYHGLSSPARQLNGHLDGMAAPISARNTATMRSPSA